MHLSLIHISSGDNEGTWTPSSRVNLIVKGGFYGVPPLAHRTPEPTDYDKPILWIPHNTGPIDNSCGGQAWVLGNKSVSYTHLREVHRGSGRVWEAGQRGNTRPMRLRWWRPGLGLHSRGLFL